MTDPRFSERDLARMDRYEKLSRTNRRRRRARDQHSLQRLAAVIGALVVLAFLLGALFWGLISEGPEGPGPGDSELGPAATLVRRCSSPATAAPVCRP